MSVSNLEPPPLALVSGQSGIPLSLRGSGQLRLSSLAPGCVHGKFSLLSRSFCKVGSPLLACSFATPGASIFLRTIGQVEIAVALAGLFWMGMLPSMPDYTQCGSSSTSKSFLRFNSPSLLQALSQVKASLSTFGLLRLGPVSLSFVSGAANLKLLPPFHSSAYLASGSLAISYTKIGALILVQNLICSGSLALISGLARLDFLSLSFILDNTLLEISLFLHGVM